MTSGKARSAQIKTQHVPLRQIAEEKLQGMGLEGEWRDENGNETVV
jgi:hypothetical protein